VRENSARMTVALVRYDAARKALAAAHRVDEVKQTQVAPKRCPWG
jgi:hypothetical protein